MEIAALGRSAGPADDEDDAPSLTVVLDHPVTESELLLRDAEEEAAEIRRRAHAEAAQIRKDARAHVRERLRRAAATAQEVTAEASAAAVTMADEARALHDEARQHAEEAAKRREAAATAAEHLLERAEAAAAEIHRRAEDDALAMLQEAWNASASLQEELLDEAMAEVDAMLARAEADAGRLRVGAEELFRESQLLRQEAEVIREQARRYADGLATVALEATPAPAPALAPAPSQPAGRTLRLPHRRWLLLVVAVLAATVVLRSFVVEPQTIAGESMEPALHDGERVLVNKLVYRLHDPRRGDVVVIGGDDVWGDRLIKRVVGLPGETVEIRGDIVRVDGRRVDIGSSSADRRDVADRAPRVEYRVGADEVLVLGDNRAASRDSRSFGPVPLDDIIGRVDAVFWPPSELGGV